ncbi:restriction endonuclease [Streptomyces celluloflavus]|uniref:restriction endonuclease n=1 Tax=Streptomyces celluloflavus TaxID=58344 RepID=UPI0036DBBDBE
MELEELLKIMDRAAANLAKLEEVWKRASTLTRPGAEYDDLARAWTDLLAGLPSIDGWRITGQLPDLNELNHDIAEAHFAGIPTSHLDDVAEKPGRDLADYRYRLNRARRQAARDRLQELVASVDTMLPQLLEGVPRDSLEVVTDPRVSQVTEAVSEIERLLGDTAQRLGRWGDLHRHIRFGQGHDWHDIAEQDWPSVRPDIEASAFSDIDPLPVPDLDIGQAAAGRLTGRATAALAWDKLDDDGFERLLFDLLQAFPEHQNVQWLSHTRAADRGRDLSMNRALNDTTGGSRSERVIVQAKHWRSKSVDPPTVAATVEATKLWEPPAVRVLIIATSGRFSSDAIMWIEKRNESGSAPFIEMWPDSRLETLLAQKPHIAAAHGLK